MNKSFIRLFIPTLAVGLALSCSSTKPGERAAPPGTPGSDVVINNYKPEARNTARAQAAPYVLMVSLDGFRFDYAQRYRAKNLLEMEASGATSEGLIPIYPSKTFPNHYALVTGLYADQHGIVSNEFLERTPDGKGFEEYRIGTDSTSLGKWYLGEPLWITAEKNGFISASYFWVGSEAPIQNSYPNWYVKYNKATPNLERVQTVIDWFKLPADQRPHFVTLYFSDVDDAGHSSGPESETTEAAVLAIDRVIGELRAQLKALPFPVNLIVVSDHGMEKLDPTKLITLERVDLSAFRIHGLGTMMKLYLLDRTRPEKIDQAVAALKALGAPMRVLRRDEMAKYHYSGLERVGDIVLEPDAPFYIMAKPPTDPLRGGNHGWDPKRFPNMRGIFFAEGPNFRPGMRLPPFENVHVYPMISEILGFETLPQVSGNLSVTKGVLRK